MKNLTIFLILLTVGCKKEPQMGDVTFYNISCNAVNPTVYVDGERVGITRKIVQKPVCGDEVHLKIITKEYEVGEHYWVLDDGRGSYPKRYFVVEKKCQQLRVD
jgi:hypothetical protein